MPIYLMPVELVEDAFDEPTVDDLRHYGDLARLNDLSEEQLATLERY
jgi:hypothetical protein